MAEYIIRGGSFGSFSNFASAGKVTRLNLFFPKKSDMEKLYPQVKKQPILLPIFWIVRIVKKSFKGNAASSIKKIKAMNVSSNSAELFKNIGL